MVAHDEAARRAALDAERSFIVQAPAGSGKTELLIQRYLVLLATVEEPEQVIAITFTRKAAAEMRRRVRRALAAARAEHSPAHPHEARTHELARIVAARDQERQWSIDAQPQRLRIDTLDAFNVWLSQQLPLLAGGAAAAQIVDDAGDFYRKAARRVVDAVEEHSPAGRGVRVLLRSLDNDFSILESLLAGLLPKRDQWLERFAGSSPNELRATLEDALRNLVGDQVRAVAHAWSHSSLDELAALLRHAAHHATDAGLRAAAAPWLALAGPPGPGYESLAAWRGAAALLLTREGQWRRQLTKQQGFGPDHAAERARLRALLAALAVDDRLRDRLALIAESPEPSYTELQWDHLAALRTVLVRLAAELKVLFADERRIDFVELGLAARRALGASDAPSDLLLALDRRIQHVLVDEFQDTSQSQLHLLELLTEGWQPGDGRTLFLVGDPMQSIYRFRDADMSLFLRAKQDGIGSVRLDSLALGRNFRSAPAIVEWVNRVFAGVFPAVDDLASGTAGFHSSAATREPGEEQTVNVHALDERSVEIETVIEILRAERARTATQSIAVLVQSRGHLEGLHERLRVLGWPVHAVEIDGLDEHQPVQDLVGLTRALLHLGDRVAWLAALHAPWFGVSWADLHALCADSPDRTIWELMHETPHIEQLSPDGRHRIQVARERFRGAFAARADKTLARWVEDTWTQIDGPACLDELSEHSAVDQFFALLARLERRGDLDDTQVLEAAIQRAQPQSDPPRESGIEIMTMHRAKGLEFDTVVLLGLGREPRPDDPKALYWMQRASAEAADELIFAPLTNDDDDRRLVSFVRNTERQRDAAERARLLYVAATRARERLHLVCQLAGTRERPAASTLLNYVWPEIALDFEQRSASPAPPPSSGVIEPVLRRLADIRFDTFGSEAPTPHAETRSEARPEFLWVGAAAVHVGTVVHANLQRIAEEGLPSWDVARIAAQTESFARELELLGVEPEELTGATTRVIAALTAAVTDVNGRWVLGAHEEARSELRLTVNTDAGLEHLRLDRTFVDNGTRWIVDFKTSRHEGGEVEAFLDSEVERYRKQLERYAETMASIDNRPIELALYFPLLQALRSWPFGE